MFPVGYFCVIGLGWLSGAVRSVLPGRGTINCGVEPARCLQQARPITAAFLYQHFYAGLPIADCFFPDYVLEEAPRGCIPKYPLIFELKHPLTLSVDAKGKKPVTWGELKRDAR